MAKLLFYILALGSFAFVSAKFPTLQSSDDSTDAQISPFATTLSRWLVDTVSQKLASLSRILNLKLRLARFLVSLYTTENLMLFRNLIENALYFGNLTLQFIPMSTEDPGLWWLPALRQFLDVNSGSGGIFGLFLGQPTGSDDLDEASSENTDEISTNPPIFFNAPASSTDQPDSNDVNNSDDMIKSRSALPEIRYINEDEPEIIDDVSTTEDDILKIYEGRIMTLDKLINSKRK